MKIAVFGTGMVGRAISAKLAQLGHEVMMGTRDTAHTLARSGAEGVGDAPFAAWIAQNPGVRLGSFAEAAAHGEMLFNATSGAGSLDALAQAGAAALGSKVLVDISNPLDFSRGMPPSLSVVNTTSLAEQIQQTYPNLRVVKSLNNVTAALMVEPGLLANGEHSMFVAGNDEAARAQVRDILVNGFGWQDVIDLGDLTAARGMEMFLPLWLRLFGQLQTPMVTIRVVR